MARFARCPYCQTKNRVSYSGETTCRDCRNLIPGDVANQVTQVTAGDVVRGALNILSAADWPGQAIGTIRGVLSIGKHKELIQVEKSHQTSAKRLLKREGVDVINSTYSALHSWTFLYVDDAEAALEALRDADPFGEGTIYKR